MSRKLLLEDAGGQREFLLVGTLTVGRDPRCEISANDPRLSRRHAEFVETASGVLVRDLHSQNGITVNDVNVKEAALRSGDLVQVAGMCLRFIEEASPEPAVAPGAADDEKTAILKGPPRLAQSGPAQSGPALSGLAQSGLVEQGPIAPVLPVAPIAPIAPPSTPEPPRTISLRGPGILAGPGIPGGASDDGDTWQVAAKETPTDAPAPGGDDEDRTRVVARPPSAARRGGRASPDAGVSARGSVSAAPARAVPAGQGALAGAPPGAAQRGPSGSGAVAGGQAGATTDAAPRSPALADGADRDDAPSVTMARAPRGSWAGRVLLRVLVLGLFCALVSALPLMYWHGQQMNAVSLSRATTMGRWFAAEVAVSLEAGRDPGAAVEALSREPGVVAARVLAPDGRVIAPASRGDQVVSAIPGVQVAPSEMTSEQHGWNGELLEVAQPVATSRGPRTALVWLTVNPATEFNGSSFMVVAPAILLAVLVAWLIAGVITRPTLKALGHLNEDVELLLGGRLTAVTDPVGAKPVQELANAINYLAARLKASDADLSARPGPGEAAAGSRASASDARPHAGGSPPAAPAASRPGHAASAAAPGAAARPPVAASRVPAAPIPAPLGAGQLIVDTAFRVVEANQTCADLLGVSVESLVGQHLLDAIGDRLVADAALGCLSALPSEGERTATVTDATRREIAVAVARAGKDQPVTITLRVTEARQA